MAATITDQAIADLTADINAASVRLQEASDELDTLQAELEADINTWATTQDQERATWDANEGREIAKFKAEMTAVVTAYITKLRRHLRASCPDATHNGQLDPTTPVTPLPSGFQVKTDRYSSAAYALKVPGTFEAGFSKRYATSVVNSTSTPLAASATFTGVAESTLIPAGDGDIARRASAVTVSITTTTAATVTIRAGDSVGVSSFTESFSVDAGTSFVFSRITKSGTANERWLYYRVDVTNAEASPQSTLTVLSELAVEADPVITYRPIYTGYLREECKRRAGATYTEDRFSFGGPDKQGYSRTSYWAVTTTDQPVESHTTTGRVERIITPFSVRIDAPTQGCSAVENREIVPIYRTFAAS